MLQICKYRICRDFLVTSLVIIWYLNLPLFLDLAITCFDIILEVENRRLQANKLVLG